MDSSLSFKISLSSVTFGAILGYWWAGSSEKKECITKKKIQDENKATVFHLMTQKDNAGYYSKRKDTIINQHVYQKFLTKIRNLPKINQDWIIILDTYGGALSFTNRIMERIYQHRIKGHKVTAVVPNHALSAGTLIALSCDKILMEPYAELGPVDVQFMGIPASSIADIVEKKDIKASDLSYLAKNMSEKGIEELKENLEKYLSHHSDEARKFIETELLNNRHTHGKAFYSYDVKEIFPVEELKDDLLDYSMYISNQNKNREVPC